MKKTILIFIMIIGVMSFSISAWAYNIGLAVQFHNQTSEPIRLTTGVTHNWRDYQLNNFIVPSAQGQVAGKTGKLYTQPFTDKFNEVSRLQLVLYAVKKTMVNRRASISLYTRYKGVHCYRQYCDSSFDGISLDVANFPVIFSDGQCIIVESNLFKNWVQKYNSNVYDVTFKNCGK